MRASIIIEIGWCGFGFDGGLIPDARLGLLRFAWCRGSLLDKAREWQASLRRAASALRP